eukprot:1156620-Pelagomonas_calceolata.AAC.13
MVIFRWLVCKGLAVEWPSEGKFGYTCCNLFLCMSGEEGSLMVDQLRARLWHGPSSASFAAPAAACCTFSYRSKCKFCDTFCKLLSHSRESLRLTDPDNHLAALQDYQAAALDWLDVCQGQAPNFIVFITIVVVVGGGGGCMLIFALLLYDGLDIRQGQPPKNTS